MSTITYPHIAFIGRAGTGKTTAAELLVKHHGYERMSFAAPMKIMLGMTTDRQRLQEFGTDVVRAYEPDAWVRLFLHELDHLERAREYKCRFVVDDCRFENEAWALKAEGFVIVRVVAADLQRVTRLRANGKLGPADTLHHSSETELDGFRADHIIANVEGPEALLDELNVVLERETR